MMAELAPRWGKLGPPSGQVRLEELTWPISCSLMFSLIVLCTGLILGFGDSDSIIVSDSIGPFSGGSTIWILIFLRLSEK